MKIFGSLLLRKLGFAATVEPSSISADTVFQLPAAGGGTKAIVTTDATQTLTNKTIAASGQITGIANANIDAAAAISFSKLAALTDGNILIGNGSNVATSVAPAGDVVIANDGTTAISTGVIVNADINVSANIDHSKLVALTASRVAVTDGTGILSASASISTTELGFLDGVNSALIESDGSQAFSADQSMGGFKLTNLAAPTGDNDAARKAYVDAAVAGLSWKQVVRVASTANVVIASELENGDTIDGVTLATGDRVLLKDQSTSSQNGIYVVVASGAASRATDMDSLTPIDEVNGAAVYVAQGTANADKAYTQTATVATLGTDPVTFVQFGSGVSDHGALSGLSDDDHTIYALLAGRSGGQTLIGGTAATNKLTLTATSSGTFKGAVQVAHKSSFVLGKSGTNALSFYQALVDSADFLASMDGTETAAQLTGMYLESIANSASAYDLNFLRARSTTGNHSTNLGYLSSGDSLGALRFNCYNGTAPTDAQVGVIKLKASAAHSSGSLPTQMEFNVTGSATATSYVHMVLESGGALRLNGTPNGHLIWQTDGGGSIGAAGATRPDSAYIKTKAVVPLVQMASNSQTTGIKGHASASASIDYELPPAGPASNGYVLSSTTAGVMSWVSNSSVTSYKADWTDSTFTATISNASPGVVTATAHGLVNGQAFYFTTTGALPTGLSASTIYYVVNKTANTFEVAATYGGASINTSSAGSGTHTVNVTSYNAVHSLATQDVMVQVFDKDDGFQVGFDEVIRVDTNNVIINGTELPGGTGFRVMVLAV